MSSNLGVWYRSMFHGLPVCMVLGLLHSFPRIWPVSESCHHPFSTRVQTISAFFPWWVVLMSSISFASWPLHCVFCPAMWYPVIVVETCGVQYNVIYTPYVIVSFQFLLLCNSQRPYVSALYSKVDIRPTNDSYNFTLTGKLSVLPNSFQFSKNCTGSFANPMTVFIIAIYEIVTQ